MKSIQLVLMGNLNFRRIDGKFQFSMKLLPALNNEAFLQIVL